MPALHNPNWFRHALNHGLLGIILLQLLVIPEFVFGIDLPNLFVDLYELLSLCIISYLNFKSFRLNYGLARDFGKILKLMLVCSITAYSGFNLEILLIDIFGPKDFLFLISLFVLFLGIFLAALFGVILSAVLYAINPHVNKLETE